MNYQQLLASILTAAGALGESRESLEILKKNYFHASVKAEKSAKMAKIEEEEERIALSFRNYELMKSSMVSASEAYLQALAHEKELWSEYEEIKKYGSEYLKDLEESRLQFLKRCMEKYVGMESLQLAFLTNKLTQVNAAIGEIVPGTNSSDFCNRLLKFGEITREDWVSYEQWKDVLKAKGENPLITEENYISSDVDYKPMDSSVALMKSLLYSIIPSRRKQSFDSSSTDRSTLMETPGLDTFERASVSECSKILLQPEQWPHFISILDSRKYIAYVEANGIDSLSGLISTVISLMMNEKLFTPETFCKIINFSHSFYTIDKKKQYLFTFLSSHPIFQSYTYWTQAVLYTVSQQLNSEKILFKKNQLRLKKQGKKGHKPSKNSAKSTICSIFSQFNFYMINLGTSIEIASKVLFDCGKKLKLDLDRLLPIISELHSIQLSISSVLSRHKSLRVNSKSRSKWGLQLYLGLCLDFLPISEIPILLTVCKAWHNILIGHFYREALITYGNLSYRKQAWASILYKPSSKKYSEIYAELLKNPKSVKELSDVIHMDVLRSYANNPRINSQLLEEILKAYAFYKPKVGYCQGMHYLAGTLTQILGHGEVAFWAIDEIIRVHHMQDLYSEDMTKLKAFFYILERLITMHAPEVRFLLNSENIVSSNYSATWFITLFAGQLASRTDLLLRIWDYFIMVKHM